MVKQLRIDSAPGASLDCLEPSDDVPSGKSTAGDSLEMSQLGNTGKHANVVSQSGKREQEALIQKPSSSLPPKEKNNIRTRLLPLLASFLFLSLMTIVGLVCMCVYYREKVYGQQKLPQNLNTTLQQKIAEVEQLRTDMIQLNIEIEVQETTIQRSNKEFANIVKEKSKQLQGLQTEMDGLRSNIENLKDDVDSKNAEIESQTAELESLRDMHENLIQEKTKQIGELQGEFKKLGNEVDEVSQVLKRREVTIERLQADNELLKNINQKILNEKNTLIGGLQGELEQRTRDAEEMKYEMEKKSTLIEKEIIEKNQLREEFQNYTKEAKDRAIQIHADCGKELGELRAKNAEVENELSELKTLHFGNEDWDSELHIAAEQKNGDLVEELVQNHADLNAKNKYLLTPLHKAASHLDDENYLTSMHIIKHVILMGADVFAKDQYNYTFLHDLLASGTILTPADFHQIVLVLISKNFVKLLDIPGSEYGGTPFQWAVQNLEVNEDTISLLHKHGANFNAVDKNGDSLLHYAVEGGRSTTLLSNLVNYGAEWKHLNNNNESLLIYSAASDNLEALRYFLNLGLNVNHVDGDGDTPLHAAVRFGEKNVLEMVRLLIDNGADLNTSNNDGLTPLAVAINREEWEDGIVKNVVIQVLKG